MTEQSTKIQRLLPRHYKIIDLALAGHDNQVIAEVLGLNPRTVGMILRSPLVQHELARARERSKDSEIATMDHEAHLGKIRSILEQGSAKAALTQVALLDSSDASVQLRASNSILDRVYGSREESRATAVVNITNEQVHLLVLALKETKNAGLQPPANGTTAQGSSDEQVPVHEITEVGKDDGRQWQVQEPNDGKKVV